MAQMISTIRNGVDTQQLFGTLDTIAEQPELGAFTFRASNRWINGAHNRSRIQAFYRRRVVEGSRREAFVVDAGEPPVLLGTDSGPNAAEYLLHALAACLTTTIVYSAAARKIRLTEVESVVEGDMDVRGCFGLSEAVCGTGSRGSVPSSAWRAMPRVSAWPRWSRTRRSGLPCWT